MFRKAAICAVAFMGASLTEAAKLQQEITKRDGAHGHDHAHAAAAPAAPAGGYSAPAASYSAPAASYGAPAASYGAPAATYGAPAPSYEEPAPSYGAPAPSYGAPVSYEEEQPGFFPDVTFIIVGILIVVGLSLLFPTYVSLTTVRRKRDVAEGKNRRPPRLSPSPSSRPPPPRSRSLTKAAEPSVGCFFFPNGCMMTFFVSTFSLSRANHDSTRRLTADKIWLQSIYALP